MLGYQILRLQRYSTHCAGANARRGRRSAAVLEDALVGGGAAHLDREVATVDVVAEEEVPRVGWVPSNLEQLHQVELCARGSCDASVSRARMLAPAPGRVTPRVAPCEED
mgnify:CR=1 FL=1